jgi:hypothetical protein
MPQAVYLGFLAGKAERHRFQEGDHPKHSSSSVAVEEHLHGDTCWVAIRARGAEWSWLTPDEAAELGRQWVEMYAGIGTKRQLALAMTEKLAA